MVLDWSLYLALVVALALGFFLGCRYNRKKNMGVSSPSPIDNYYFKGLNFLLNEQPDAAIDTFIGALEVNSETLETHLALGNLLRKRGEVDRAIRIHQNLLARPGLSLLQTHQVQYELAIDFMKSGLLDRAEGLLKKLVAHDGEYKIEGLKRLLELYRDEKEWNEGLNILQQLAGSRLSRSYEDWALKRAHFCCELAEQEIIAGNYSSSRQWLKQALGYDKQNIRAGLLLGRLEIAVGEVLKGVNQLQKVALQNIDYAAEVIPYLSDAYQQQGNIESYRSFLSKLYNETFDPSVLLVQADLITESQGELAAAEYVAAEVMKRPSSSGLYKLLEYYLAFSEGKTRDYLYSLRSVMKEIIANESQYQCRNCGFTGKQLHWLCPSCKTWGEIKLKRS